MDNIKNLELSKFIELIDSIYDGVEIWDNNYRLLYTNKASYRLYGIYPEKLVGKTLNELMNVEKFWSPSTLPYVYENKKSIMQKQKTSLGYDILTIAIPILDCNGEVEYVVMSARDSYDELSTKLSAVEKKVDEDEILSDVGIVFSSAIMKSLMKTAKKVAQSNTNCLILGETGTGKSVLAKYIHTNSDRKDKKLVTINMASINPNVIESELFGYKKGSFTGANKEGKKGLIEIADRGTLFLDEIGELPLSLQAKFLHVLQEEEFMPIGGLESIKIDIRVIAATNCNLEDMVKAGTFREDLYHRLNVIELSLPPIRERGKDLGMMISFYLNIFNKKYKRNCHFSVAATDKLLAYKWKGNIRELSNAIERCVVMADDDEITTDELPKQIFKLDNYIHINKSLREINDINKALGDYEAEIVKYHYKNNKSTRQLAKVLNVSQTTVRRLIDKHIKSEPN